MFNSVIYMIIIIATELFLDTCQFQKFVYKMHKKYIKSNKYKLILVQQGQMYLNTTRTSLCFTDSDLLMLQTTFRNKHIIFSKKLIFQAFWNYNISVYGCLLSFLLRICLEKFWILKYFKWGGIIIFTSELVNNAHYVFHLPFFSNMKYWKNKFFSIAIILY